MQPHELAALRKAGHGDLADRLERAQAEDAAHKAQAAKYGTFRGVSMTPGTFHEEERRQRRAHAAFRGRYINERARGRHIKIARAPQRFQSVRSPRSQRRTRTAAASRDGPSSEDPDPPLDLLDAAVLRLGWSRIA